MQSIVNTRERHQSLASINQQAIDVLVKQTGIVNTLRFLGQFGVGTGNYTIDRKAWIDMPLDEITSSIKATKSAK